MTIVASAEAPRERLMARIRLLADGRYRVDAVDGEEAWTTEPIESLTEAWKYIDDWFQLRGVEE